MFRGRWPCRQNFATNFAVFARYNELRDKTGKISIEPNCFRSDSRRGSRVLLQEFEITMLALTTYPACLFSLLLWLEGANLSCGFTDAERLCPWLIYYLNYDVAYIRASAILLNFIPCTSNFALFLANFFLLPPSTKSLATFY